MAHFAQLDNDNKVLQVIVVNNTELLDENEVEQEQKGIDFCKSLLGADTKAIVAEKQRLRDITKITATTLDELKELSA